MIGDRMLLGRQPVFPLIFCRSRVKPEPVVIAVIAVTGGDE